MAPPQGQMRPGRQLAVLGLIFVVLYLLVFLAGAKGSFTDRLEPRLGLDLIGGSRVTYTARTQDGSAPPAENLEEARQIIEQRANAYGVSEAEVVTEGNRNIVVSLAGESNDQLANLGQAAELRFRKVLKIVTDTGAAAASPTPSGSASPNPSVSPSANAAATNAPTATASPGGQGGGLEATPTPTPSGSASPSPSGSANPSADGMTRDQLRAEAQKKVGAAAWNAASALETPPDLSQDPTAAATYAPFGKLSGEEVAALDAKMQFNVPTITCAQLNDRPPGSIQDATQQAVACNGAQKYLMDVAKVLGTDVDDASGVYDQQNGEWVVSLDFTGDGQKKWTDLTREAFDNAGSACDQAALGDEGRCRVAVVLDNTILSDPEIQGVLTGDSQIQGSFTSKSANELASQLRFGALPLTFDQSTIQNVSATLGTEHLKAGLLAAGIGMLLVVVYAFFYYRLLGTVIFLSLVLSGLLVFGALVVLGRQIGYTLTLFGIAGFIVSLGVAADSFVIYFERLKDEIREGRSPRSAVPRAWARARRTIISANVISLLAAVVLYLTAVGVVKGFAFALGLATILDLVVVFLFRHPIMTMFARTRAFLSPRVSGLGRAVQSADETKTGPRSTRVKEA